MTYKEIWEKHALLREGERLTAYLDTEGKPTVGIGHLILPSDGIKVGDKITKNKSREFFDDDSHIATAAALRQAKEIGIETNWFIAALISVNFQLGTKWTEVFKSTYPAIIRHDFETAINNLRRSKWYRQTPVRVEDFIQALERAKTFKERPLKKTRTMQGASVAAVSVVASETVSDITEKIEPLVQYSDHLQWIFVTLALIGIGLTIYARVDDRKKGNR